MGKIKIEIKWAIISILVLAAWMLAEKWVGLHDKYIDQHATYTLFYFIPATLIFTLALWEKRTKDFGGAMTYMQGFKSGMIISAGITLITPLAQYAFTTWISPEYFENAIKYVVRSEGVTQEGAEQYFNTTSYMIQSTISAPIMGLFLTAVVALFLKNKTQSDNKLI